MTNKLVIVKAKNMFINKTNLYVLFSSIIILFTSWTVYYQLPYGFYFILCFTIWNFVKYNPLSPGKINLFISFFIISMWFYLPYKVDITSLIVGMISAISLSAIFFIDKQTICRIIDCLFSIIAGIVAFGLAAHLMRFFNIYDFPQITIIEQGDDRVYAVYLLHVYEELYNGFFVYFRFYSIFDEPGYLGTITAFYLIYQDFDFKKTKNIILFLGGIFTFSLAFYILSMSYILLKLFKNKKIIIILTLAFALFIGFNQIKDTDIARSSILRPEFTSDDFSSSRGDLDVIRANIEFIKTQDFFPFLFGNGAGSHLYVRQSNLNKGEGVVNSTIFRLFYQIGVLGVFYLIAFIVLNVKKDSKSIYFAVAFIISLIQRPQVFEPIFVLLLAVNLKLVSDNQLQSNNIKNNKGN